MAERIQRSRARGWRMPEGAVYVGRPSKWGNPYKIGKLSFPPGSGKPDGPEDPRVYPPIRIRTAAHAVALYRELWRVWLSPAYPSSKHCHDALAELRGKDLCCWCPLVDKDGNPVPCHADVLLELANAADGVRAARTLFGAGDGC